MMNKLILPTYLAVCTIFHLHGQQTYWQQKVSYTMHIDMDVNNHTFKGKQTLTYTNNSPDTIDQVFYHLYYNAFQPGSEMDIRSRNLPDPDRRVGSRISQLKPDQTGYHQIKILQQDGQPINYKTKGTILQAKLNQPLPPGKSTVLYMEFDSQVPIQIRRTGRNSIEGVDYSMAQWYPKLCEYDYQGWHSHPYIGREFYGVWGDFDVTIHIDSRYTLGATGYLQNPDEARHGYQTSGTPQTESKKTIWHFIAPNVHDFVWAADRDYVVDYAQVPDGPKLYFVYQGDTLVEYWKNLAPYMVKFFQIMEKKFGKYPYDVFSFIQGGDGGMEYPMATLITARGSFHGLVSVSVHEAAHNWFYGVLATHELLYPWMDEGFTTYAQDYVLNLLFDAKSSNPFEDNYKSYLFLAQSPDREPLSTHGDFYKKNMTYGISSYSAGAVFLHQLSYIIGQDVFDKGMLRYFNEWKFKHPTPNDFIRVMEKTSGIELNWYLEQFVYTTNNIDYGIQSVIESNQKTTINLQRIGAFPMPVDLIIKLENGKHLFYHIPLDLMRGVKNEILYNEKPVVADSWFWVDPNYTLTIPYAMNKIKSITINPDLRMADIDLKNNAWSLKP